MNELQETENFAADWQGWLDRLVDAELTENQQRQLLLAMEAQPDIWRRCALAFIEAQTLRQEFRGLMDSPHAVKTHEAVSASGKKPASRRFQWQSVRWWSVAASFFVAFLLGTIARGLWPSGALQNQNPALVAMATGVGNSVSTPSGVNNLTPVAAQTYRLTVPTSDGQAEQTVDVPLVEGNEKDFASLLAQQNPVLSDAVLATLESTGHQVQQRRTYYPVQLEDGRQAVVPVDYAEVSDTRGWQ